LAYSHAIVEELAGFGARVHTCSRNAAELEDSRRRWEEKNMRVTVSVCDVSVRAEREKLMETVKETFDGKLDILVSFCQINTFTLQLSCSPSDVRSIPSLIGKNVKTTDASVHNFLSVLLHAGEQCGAIVYQGGCGMHRR
jgi:NAD(P)-dependent dehydrogenase (short-subunit alcohol dehydrogenase family)